MFMSDLAGVKSSASPHSNSTTAKCCIRRKKICSVTLLLFTLCEKIANKLILRYVTIQVFIRLMAKLIFLPTLYAVYAHFSDKKL